VGLPPDRAPRDDDWAWLNALAGHPEPDTEKRVLRETKLLAEALKEALGGMEPPREPLPGPRILGLIRNQVDSLEPPQDDLADRFQASSSLSAKDFDESRLMDSIESAQSSFSSAERIPPRASFSKASRTYSDDDGIYPEPTGNGFARLRRRLRDAGLL
jgi:hypothetical protein